MFTPEQFELLVAAALAKAPSIALALLGALLLLLAGYFVSRWAAGFVRKAGERLPVNDRTLFTFLEKVVKVAVFAIAGVAALAQIGVPITSFVALLGAIGLGVGLALKDTLSDLAAGLVLLVIRPFGVGDGVEIDSTEGTVKEIGLFAVRLLSWDGVMVTVPNSRVWANRMKNLVVHGTRRVDIPVGVAYGVDLKEATEVLVQAVASDSRVKAEPAPVVVVQNFGDNAVTLVVRFWVDSGDLLQARSDLTLAVKVALDASGIPIPFPQREIRLVAS